MATFKKYTDEVSIHSFSGVELDPDWEYIDKAGHRHYAVIDIPLGYPTLEWFVDSIEYLEGEEYEHGHWVCPLCLETIKRGTRPEKGWMPGLTHYKIDGVEVSEEKWHEEYEKAADRER